MKKILSSLCAAFLLFGMFSIQSCEKCTNCSYTYIGPNGTELTYDYPELCGDKDDINNLEDLCNQEAEGINGDCFCD
jgi:hypothetical protein